MQLKTYRAFTLAEAIDAVQADLGEDAVVLHTRTYKRGGILGIGRKMIVEVIASEPVVEEAIEEQGASEVQSPLDVVASRAYRSGSLVVDSDPQEEESLELDDARTARLAQALDVRREREVAVAPQSEELVPDVPVDAGAPRRFVIGEGGKLIAEDVSEEAPVVTQPVFEETQPVIEEAQPVIEETKSAIEEASEETLTTEIISDAVNAVVNALRPRSEADAASVSAIDSVEKHEPVAPQTEVDTDAELVSESSVVPEAPAIEGIQPLKHDLQDPHDELEAIRATVGRVIKEDGLPTLSVDEKTESDVDPANVPSLTNAYAELISQELSRELADQIIKELSSSLGADELADPSLVREAILDRLAGLVPTSESTRGQEAADGRPWTLAFVGPTGVGKTTTLAKVASKLALQEGRRVGLVTADTYRVAAVDQLRIYAEILDLPLAVAKGAADIGDAIRSLEGCDVVLIDTPGRSQNDAERIGELRSIIDISQPHEVHLVLSGTAGERVLLREAEAFASLRPDRIVLTKLDEAVSFGMLVSVVRQIGRRVSWVTTGQEVPSDIEPATGRRIASMILGASVKA